MYRIGLGLENWTHTQLCNDIAYLAVGEECAYVVLVFAYSVRELCDVVVTVLVERAQDTDAHVARLTVEPHRLVTVLTTFNVLLSLNVEQRMTAGHLYSPANNI